MKKIIYVFAAAALLLMPSCQQFEPEIFDESAAERANSFLADIRETLVAEQYGWTLDYYPKKDFAGTTYALKFTSQQVTAIHESAPSVSETSTYALKYDNASVLSFDTYNSILHKYATPNSEEYQAKGGDFEFEIRGFNKETKEIKLVGKRSRCVCTLRPLKKEAKDYLSVIKGLEPALPAAFKGTVADSVMVGFLDAGIRTLSFAGEGSGEYEDVRYVVTDKGIRFMTPFTFNGVTFSEFIPDESGEHFAGGDISFEKVCPEGWISYEKFKGNYTLTHKDGSFQVALEADETGIGFYMTGLSSEWKLPVRYNSGRGILAFNVQRLGGNNTHQFWFCALDAGLNQFTWSTDAGMISEADNADLDEFTITFVNDGKYTSVVWASFYITAFSGEPSKDSYDSAGLPRSWYFVNGSSYLQGPITIKKIAE